MSTRGTRGTTTYPAQRMARLLLAREQEHVKALSQQNFTPREVASITRMDPKTVAGWLRQGKIRGWRLGVHGNWRVSQAELDRLLANGPRPVGQQENA
jgi:excisionase family DNA binding protein